MRVVWQSEIDEYASKVLRKHWPDVPNLGDATVVDWESVERPDVLAGGFACQDLSVAGEMAGLEEGTRSGTTWRALVRAIVSLRPRYVLVENVPMLLSGDGGRWFSTVLGALAALGYDAEWDCIPAAAVGAEHLRNRVFLVAYPLRTGLAGRGEGGTHAADARVFPKRLGFACGTPMEGLGHLGASRWRGDVHGIPRRVDRIKGTGNAVVPQVAELIGGWIIQHHRATEVREREMAEGRLDSTYAGD